MRPLQRQYLALQARSLDRSSRWYEQDMSDLEAHVRTMSDERCAEALARWRSVAALTQAEMDLHFQFPMEAE